ncbi:Mobile element protein [Azospirillum argentinense]
MTVGAAILLRSIGSVVTTLAALAFAPVPVMAADIIGTLPFGIFFAPADDTLARALADPVVATAILDRLLHHSHVITIRGDSYRLREKRRAGLLKTNPAPAVTENTL